MTQRLRFLRDLWAGIRWADVIHFHYLRPAVWRSRDLRWIAQSGKPHVVEVWGTDIRKREVAAANNHYLAQYYRDHPASGLSSLESRRWQQEFADHGFALLAPGLNLLNHVDSDVFSHVYTTAARVCLSDFDPVFPSTDCRRPLIVHSPSKPELKGTSAVLAAVDQLRPKRGFEFKLLHKVPHAEALATVRNCDIFVDQLVLGGYGLASIEAMAFGKPVVCYINNPREYPADLPILNATQETLPDVLEGLLADSRRRREIGHQSRTYVERHHDARHIALKLVAIYRELIERGSAR
jgi:glycosyltransferase involved in cell wall biosynthesis